MASMGGFRSPNGQRGPAMRGGMGAPSKGPGKIAAPMSMPGAMGKPPMGAGAPGMGFKKGGPAKAKGKKK